MTAYTEPDNLKDFLVWEEERGYSRAQVTFASGETISLAEIVGEIAIATPTTGTADAGNIGDGLMSSVLGGSKTKLGTYTATCTSVSTGVTTITVPATGTAGSNTGNGTMDPVADGGSAIAGIYTMTCTDASVSGSEIFSVSDPNNNLLNEATVDVAYTSDQIDFTLNDDSTDFIVGDSFTVTCTAATADHDSGIFKVVDPDGMSLPDAVVDVAYANENLNFTIADGSTDFATGDIFTVLVAAGSGEYVEVEAAAVDGSQNAAGISIDGYDASSAAVEGVIITRDAIIIISNLVWPSGATTAQKTAWLAQFADRGIIVREES